MSLVFEELKLAVSQVHCVKAYKQDLDPCSPFSFSNFSGHVDAGKSTLMGRLLLELGSLSDRQHSQNERASQKIGMGSFAYAWALDSSEEERER